jgi:hypothetical protein
VSEADPYQVLGVERGAPLEDIRRAFRRAALRCHPDRRRDDPEAAEREFQRVTHAYRTLLRRRGRKREAQRMRAVSPAELARRAAGPRRFVYAADDPDVRRHLAAHPEAQRVSLPRVNETAVFVGFWVLAVVISAAATLASMRWLLAGRFHGQMSTGDVLLIVGVALSAYLAVLAATIAGLLASRRVLWVVAQIGLLAMRLLPGRSAPRDLPADERSRPAEDAE